VTIQLVNNDWCNYVIASVYMLKIVNVFFSFNFVKKNKKKQRESQPPPPRGDSWKHAFRLCAWQREAIMLFCRYAVLLHLTASI